MNQNKIEQKGEFDSSLAVTDSPVLKPDINQSWGTFLKKNLFGGWKNTLLTILTAIFLGYILYYVGAFVLTSDWDVVYNHIRLLMIGQFPIDEIWRLWVSLLYFSALVGLTWGIWKGPGKVVAFTFTALYAIFASFSAFQWVSVNSSILLAAAISLIFIGYFAGDKLKSLAVPTIVLWALFLPISFGLLQGFWGLFDPVRSQHWGGFLLTVILASFTIVGCFPIGILLALGRRSKLPVIKWFCITYIELIRGTPLIMVLFIGQIFIPLLLGGVNIENVIRAMWAYTFFSSAYLAENVRSGLQAIPNGQYEAAQALGLNKFKMMVLIILPQALKVAIPAMVGQFITVLKDTSLVAIIGLADFLGTARRISNNPDYLGRYLELYVFVAVFYFIFCSLMAYISRYLERSLSNGTN